MKFILRINMNGAAFDDGAAPAEVARMLREAAEQIEGWQDVPNYFQNLRDVNGNIAGQYAAKPDDYCAGYRWTSNDERVYFGEVFTDETEAACMADEHARVFAESAREDSERFEAMTLAELDAEEKLLEVQKAFALRHRAKFGGPERVRDAIEELRTARRELREATAAYERG